MNHRIPSLTLAIAAIAIVVVAPWVAAAELAVSNFTDGETIRYPVPLLRGTLADTTLDQVTVTNLTATDPALRTITGVAHNGRFKALTELVPGENRLELTAGDEKRSFTLTYQPQTNPQVIRAVYFVDNTGDTRYETPFGEDDHNYEGKFDAAMKLMQSFTAEWMNHYGYGRRTFNLEFNDRGKVVVHVVRGERPADWYRYELDGVGHLYGVIGQEVARALPEGPTIECVLIGFSKLDRETGRSVAYTALGGGKMALFGGACMYAFPDSIAEVQAAFVNPMPIDPTAYVSDSAGRHTMWSIASTSIGAMMHEVGHSMGLPHTVDWRDMMTRGMDHIGRNFVFYDPPSHHNAEADYFGEDQIGYWSPESAAALAPTVWLDMDATTAKQTADETEIALSEDGKDIVVSSPHGIGFLGYEVPGAARDFVYIDQSDLPREVRLPLRTALDAVGDKPGQLRILDGNGVMSTMRLAELSGEFVRAWQLTDRAVAWDQSRGMPQLSAADVRGLAARLMQQPMTVSPSARVNLDQQFPNSRAPRVAYAYRTIRTESRQPIRLMTGSDDGLRIWLNGELVVNAPNPRAARPDSETTQAVLEPGNNHLLVEVTDSGDAWALYLRMTDPEGTPLRLNDDGTLTPVPPPAISEAKR